MDRAYRENMRERVRDDLIIPGTVHDHDTRSQQHDPDAVINAMFRRIQQRRALQHSEDGSS